MAKSVEWNEKWARLDKGIRHPTKLEVNQHGSTLRPLHSLTAASPGTSADFDGSRSSPSLGSTDPLELAGSTGRDSVGSNRSVSWGGDTAAPAARRLTLTTTQQFYQERPVTSSTPELIARPTLSTQKQLAHNAYLFGNVDVVAPMGKRDTATPLQYSGWVRPMHDRARSCPPTISSNGQFPDPEAKEEPGWRSSKRLSRGFGGDRLAALLDHNGEEFPVGGRQRAPVPQVTTVIGPCAPNAAPKARGMGPASSLGPDDIRRWARPHAFNSSGKPNWPWDSAFQAPLGMEMPPRSWSGMGDAPGPQPEWRKSPDWNPATPLAVPRGAGAPGFEPCEMRTPFQGAKLAGGVYGAGTTHWRV